MEEGMFADSSNILNRLNIISVMLNTLKILYFWFIVRMNNSLDYLFYCNAIIHINCVE